jgi:hypothetical protein
MQDDRDMLKYASVVKPPLGFPTAVKFCQTCQCLTPHQFRGVGTAGSVRLCVCCLERALQMTSERVARG